MSTKTILIIGSLSIDEIHLGGQPSGAGSVFIAEKSHKELGGRGGNTAICAYRASHPKPSSSGIIDPGDGEGNIEVRLIASVANERYQQRFCEALARHGINTDSIELVTSPDDDDPDKQDYMHSFMDSRKGLTQQIVNFAASNRWTLERFDEIEKICSDYTPDLVVVTMELKKQVVEQIIETVHTAGIDILLFATPGETLGRRVYPMITHLVCNESDAAKMLGYKYEDVNLNTWKEICDLYIRKGVQNAVIRLGPLGAYYRNKDAEGYASGHVKISDLVDETGATTAFVGPYAVEFVKNKNDWNIKAATERGIKASSVYSVDIGYEAAIPWSDDIDAVEFEPLYDSIDALRAGLKKKTFGWKETRDNREPVRSHRHAVSSPP